MSEKRRRRRKTSGDSEESEEENDKPVAEAEVIAFMPKKSGRGKHSVVNPFIFDIVWIVSSLWFSNCSRINLICAIKCYWEKAS